MTKIQLTRSRSRTDRRLKAPSQLMIILIGMMIIFTGSSSDAAQKHRKYWLPGFHTGQGGLIAHQVSRWRNDKAFIQEIESMPIRLDLVIPLPILRMMPSHHRPPSRR